MVLDVEGDDCYIDRDSSAAPNPRFHHGRAAHGDRHIVGAPGCLLIFGAVLPTLWAMWQVFTIALGNSALYGTHPTDHTYFQEVPELWATAVILTLTAIGLTWMLVRAVKRPTMVVFTVLTFAAAAANWAILLLT
jgi:hypothetical protein